MNVFVSLPMHGRSEEEVTQEMRRIFGEFREWNDNAKVFLNKDDHYTLIDNYHKDLPEDAPRLVYLGDSIQKMVLADVIIFAPGWREAKGCRIERLLAQEYDIPYAFFHPSTFRPDDREDMLYV